MGGPSAEREISLITGRAIFDALKSKKYDVVALELKNDVFSCLTGQKVDVVFNALHGTWGEDGVIQGVCEVLKIPYTGSGVLASSLSMTKSFTKDFLLQHGIQTPEFQIWSVKNQTQKEFEKNITIKLPFVVKPESQGSSVGITIVREKKDVASALKGASKYDTSIMVEEFINGREITAGVLNGRALPLIEIKPKIGFYSYESKYTKGKTEYLCPAPLPPNLTQKIQDTSVKIYSLLRCRGVARADYMMAADFQFYFLEINTLPGMTSLSLVPKAAQQMGLSFPDLVEEILNSATLDLN